MIDGDRPRTRRPVPALAALLATAAVATLTLLGFTPPEPLGADAPADTFSAARAEAHLAAIAQRPHPIGTADNARVRQYITDTATAHGASTTTETGEVSHSRAGVQRLATVHNVVARVHGTAPGPVPLLLVAHHDSVPTSPGAADDGAAVAALLETLRTTAAHPPRNDVVFLFTDGEEMGLLGARAHVERHRGDGFGPVFNFEARGSGGPVWMFQTGRDNADLVSAFADASTRPVANSMAAAVYALLPNSSDFTVFLDHGAHGLNSAFINQVHHYHSPHDDLAHLDRASLQHHGETMTGLIRVLGDTDLTATGTGDAIYFDLFSRVLLHYPDTLVIPLTATSAAALAWLLVAATRRHRLRPGTLAATTAAALGTALGGAVLGHLGWLAINTARPDLDFLPLGEPYGRGWFLAGFTALAAAALLLGVRALRRRTRTELLSGVLTLTALLLITTTVVLPGGTFLFQWTLLAGLPALWWSTRHPTPSTATPTAASTPAAGEPTGGASTSDDANPGTSSAGALNTPGTEAAKTTGSTSAAEVPATAASHPTNPADPAGRGGRGDVIGLLLAALPALVAAALYPAITASLYTALGLPLAAAAMVLTLLGALHTAPLLAELPTPGRLGTTLAVAAVVLLVLGTTRTGFTPTQPRPDSLIYLREDTGATWLSPDPTTDPWTARALGDNPTTADLSTTYPLLPEPVLRAPAPTFDLPTPTTDTLSDTTTGPTRTVAVRITPATQAWRTQLTITPTTQDCAVDGTPIAPTTPVELYGKATGTTLTCRIPAGTTLTLALTDQWIGLPPEAAAAVGPRPDDSILVPSGTRPHDSALITTTATI
ncbi:M20/M25/M40 family metallo-hydrolase [Actinokineospora spheciospongiae]|uniref:M20/M25/M40 family metallo-hydrolase n=1 Tax=Actinokineospora spheciospongiae TaxID=909613 RepID=UPI000D7102EC|nr:M20/M25/M40 family metallo-hydrolase [Actinokineospora spheciospongiae]PWW63523.1 peptidase M28-like protein [Actinokineospora spheciospongiae]